jgi:hypothetical protein
MFRWKNLGILLNPQGRYSWMHSYAQNPNAIEINGITRIFFTCRPPRNTDGSCVSYIGYADFELQSVFREIGVSSTPVLELGKPGTFDEFGTMPGSVVYVPETNEIRMYYVGWQRSTPTPYRWNIGLAVSHDGGVTFKRFSEGPLLGIDLQDPYLLACPRVWRCEKGLWHMHYQSGATWRHHEGHWESEYVAKYAYSDDGLNWQKHRETCIPTVCETECQTSSSVFSYSGAPGKHQIVFSWRHGTNFRNSTRGYRLGFAFSNDYSSWNRDDRLLGRFQSEELWDREMQCYPHFFTINGRHFLFYCGNEFGRYGFGVAECIDWTD